MERELLRKILKSSTDDQFLGSCFQVTAIKEELRKRGLETDGNKEEAIQRLIAANLLLAEETRVASRRHDVAVDVPLGSWSESEMENEYQSGDPVSGAEGTQTVRTDRRIGRRVGAIGRSEQQQVQAPTETEGIHVTLHTTPDLSSTIQEYNGKRWESLKRWFASLETAKGQCNWSDAVVRGVAISRLRGEALCWQSYEGCDIESWREWKRALREAFEKPLTLREWNEMVNGRRQRVNETVAEYFGEKMSLIKRAPQQFKVSLEASIDYLISGVLDGNTRRVLRLREYSSIHQLIQVARTMDRDDDKLRFDVKAIAADKHERKQAIGRETSSIAREVQQRSSSIKQPTFNTNRRAGIVCYNCNERGHIASECPKRRHSNVKRTERAMTNCILESKWPSKGITVVDALAFGKRFEVMVDSGCERTVIKKCAVPESETIETANGQKLKVVENDVTIVGTVFVEIEIGGFATKVNAAVVHKSPFEFIVGSDWRRNANVAITTFPDASIEIKKFQSEATMVGVYLLSHNDKNEEDFFHEQAKCKEVSYPVVMSTKESQRSVDTFENEVEAVVCNISTDATKDEVKQLKALLLKHKDVFATGNDDLGLCTDIECAIRLKDDIPVYTKPYRYSHADRALINKTVNEWKEKGIIRDSRSEYGSPVVLVKRESSETTPRRLCVDYRAVNQKLVVDNYPMKHMDDVIEKVLSTDPVYFNVMDVKTAFLTIKIRDGDQHITAFVTQDGQFEFNRMPFGLNIAPRNMQRTMDDTFKHIEATSAYIDDLFQGAKTIRKLIELFAEALVAIKKRGLKISLKKIQLVQKQVSFLGYLIDEKGKVPDPKRTAAVDRFVKFEDVKAAKRFAAFCSHYRKFCRNFNQIIAPINKLFKKDVQFDFNNDCWQSVNKLKEMLKNPPVLTHFKVGRKTEVHVDASLSGFGGVIIQRDENNRERVIEFASRQVSASERNLHSNDLECGATHWLITVRFRIYLYGLDFFTVYTDNWTVAHLNAKKTINRKFARYIIELQEFNFIVKHRKGIQNVVADALSRQFDDEVIAMAIVVTKDRRLQVLQEQDAECIAILKILQAKPRTKSERKMSEQFTVIDGILCHKAEINGIQKTRIVVPLKLQATVLEMVHDRSGHGDYKRTFAKLTERFYWKGFSVRAKKYVASCEVCQRMNAKTTKATGLMTSRRVPEIPFEAVSVDHFGPLECINGYRYVIILVEHSTRYLICKPQKSTKSTEFLRFLDEEVVNKFGAPLELVSDRGTCFTSFETYEYFEKNGITHSTSPPYFPESNGLAERAVRTVKDTIRRQMNGCANWKLELNQAVFSINTSFNSSVGYTPFELLFGFQPRLASELYIGLVVESNSRMDQIEDLKSKRIQALGNLKRSQEKQETNYNGNRLEAKFKTGDKVWFTTGHRKSTFEALFEGPFVVKEKIGKRMYRIQRENEERNGTEVKVAPAERLKIFKPRTEEYGIEEFLCCLFEEQGIDEKKITFGRGASFEDETKCSVAECGAEDFHGKLRAARAHCATVKRHIR